MNEPQINIQSHKGPYPVTFGAPFAGLEEGLKKTEHLIIDAKVAGLYSEILGKALAHSSVLQIEALEENKSLEKMPEVVLRLIDGGIKRGHVLTAVGGGIIQDIAAFLGQVLFRGVAWRFYPTTLLAQADSCIGSKSSINVGRYKNQVGTFTPPQTIHIAAEVLDTLEEMDVRSGIGEMIKVHLIAGEEDFQNIIRDYPRLDEDKGVLLRTIRRSLEIKKALVEKDEFDQNERLILNFGHTFGHAIESATGYRVPHGIGVTIGLDMAHFISAAFGFLSPGQYAAVRPLLRRNFKGFEKTPVPLERFFEAILKDKKNTEKEISLILTRGPGKVFRDHCPFDEKFRALCETYFASQRVS